MDLRKAEHHYSSDLQNPCYRFEWCNAVLDEEIVTRVPKDKNVLEISGSENKIVCFVFMGALQRFLSRGIVIP